MTRHHPKIRRVRHFSIVWRGIRIRLKYQYKHVAAHRWQEPKDRLSIVIVGPNADLCPPLTEYAPSTVHVQTANLRTLGGPVAYVARMLTLSASKPQWLMTERRRRQLELFPDTQTTQQF